MKLTPLLVAKDTLLCLAKNLPGVGTVMDVVQTVEQSYEKLVLNERLSRLEELTTNLDGALSDFSDFSRQLRTLATSTVAHVLQTLRAPTIDGESLEGVVRNLRDMQEHGLAPMLFEGLLQQSTHWSSLQKYPNNYGDVLDDHGTLDPKKIQILIDADKKRILQITPFTFCQLLTNQSAGNGQSRILSAGDVWAFPCGDTRGSPAEAGSRDASGAVAAQRPCPACGQSLRLEPSAAGKELPCPRCQKMLKVSAERQQVTLVDVVQPPPPRPETARKSSSASTQTTVCQSTQPPVTVPPPRPTLEKEIAVDLGRGIKLELVLVPAGEFLMGSPDFDDEKPQHRVRITKPFYLGKYPVTQEQWQALMGANPSHFQGPKNPVECVSWEDCQEFLKKVNAKTGTRGGNLVLPTEAQWEYACRAGITTKYCFGDDESMLGEYAWYEKNSAKKTHPVGQKKPNAWGLYDMYGNVWEWCQDWFDGDYYANSPSDDPAGPSRGSSRVYRGGSWDYHAWRCRSANRDGYDPLFRIGILGFRLALVPSS